MAEHLRSAILIAIPSDSGLDVSLDELHHPLADHYGGGVGAGTHYIGYYLGVGDAPARDPVYLDGRPIQCRNGGHRHGVTETQVLSVRSTPCRIWQGLC